MLTCNQPCCAFFSRSSGCKPSPAIATNSRAITSITRRFRTEWWYYTGNVRSADGHRYGFELVFFRQGQSRDAAANPSAWRVDDLYLAHLAWTDIDNRRFRYYKRLNRAGPGIAGIRAAEGRIWNGNWEARWDREVQTLTAIADDIRLNLRLTPPLRRSSKARTASASRARARAGIPLRFVSAARRRRHPERRCRDGFRLDGPRVVLEPARRIACAAGTGSASSSTTGPSSCCFNSAGSTARSTRIPPGPTSRATAAPPTCRAPRSSSTRRRGGPARRPARNTRFAGASPFPRCTSSSNAPPRFPTRNWPARTKRHRPIGKERLCTPGRTRGVGYLEMTGYAKPMRL